MANLAHVLYAAAMAGYSPLGEAEPVRQYSIEQPEFRKVRLERELRRLDGKNQTYQNYGNTPFLTKSFCPNQARMPLKEERITIW